MAQLQYRFNKNDEYYTPAYAVIPMAKRLRPNTTIWCPFDNADSMYVKVLSDNDFTVIHTHINNGEDFFEINVPQCDYIISNPPYSLKGEVFKRLYSIGKPFAMLINFQGLFDNKERFELFKHNRIELLFLNPRVNYIKPDNPTRETGVPFQSVYACSGILKNQIEFEYINKQL